MLIEQSYSFRMDYTEGMESRMEIYAENTDLAPMRAEDFHFACMYVLLTVKLTMEAKGNVAKLHKAISVFDRLTRDPVDVFPDLGQPGLTYEDLDNLAVKCQGWYEVFEKVIETAELDVDAATLQEIVEREADYHNYKEQSEPEGQRYLAEPVPFEFD